MIYHFMPSILAFIMFFVHAQKKQNMNFISQMGAAHPSIIRIEATFK